MFKNSIYTIMVILLCLVIGKGVAHLAAILPASLYGMMVFTFLLHHRLVNEDKIKPCIEWGLAHMGVCFVPAGVGIINHFELVKQHGLMIVFIVFITTFILLTFVGFYHQRQIDGEFIKTTATNPPSS